MALGLGIGMIGVLGLLVIALYSRLAGLRAQVQNGWKEIEAQLTRRHELVASLVHAVRAVLELEPETLSGVMDAAARAGDASGPIDVARQESGLSHALARFFAVAAHYPVLEANTHARELQEELTVTEKKISSARRAYNDVATRFNTTQRTFPSSMLASAFRFRAAELCDTTEVSERRAPAVELSMRS